jgi:hypothetical protein
MILRLDAPAIIVPARRGIVLPARRRPVLPAWDRGNIAPLHAAISVVRQSTQGNFSPSASWTTSFAVLPSSGNTIIVVITAWQSTPPTVNTITDNQGVGNSYGLPTNGHASDADGVSTYIYRCKSIGATSGTFTITVNWTGAISVYGSIKAIEVSGLDTTNTDDVSSQSNLTGVTTKTQTNGSANASANDLAVGCITVDTGSVAVGLTDPPTGYSSIHVQQDGSTYIGGESAYKIVSALETSAATWSWTSGGANAYASVLATFQGAAAAAPSPGDGPTTCGSARAQTNALLVN